jgi:hypothetical protein
MAARAGDLGGVFVFFAVGAAIFFRGHAGAGWVCAFFLVGHRGTPRFISPYEN